MLYKPFIIILFLFCTYMLFQQMQYIRFVQNKQPPKDMIKYKSSTLKFKDEVDWIEYADYEFNIDESKLPKSKDVIFQVIITDQIDHWAGKNVDDSKVEKMTEPLCKSAKTWNEGLITLHTSNSNFEFCDGWENSFIVKFDAKMVKHVSLHDERLFVVEQFIKKYRLYERYGNIMLSDSDVFIVRNNSWNYFDKECPSEKFWFAFWDDSCDELYYDPFSATSSQIKDCYGESTLKGMYKSKMKNLNFPIAGRGRYFTKLLEDANKARIAAIKNMNNNSPKTVCDMASVFYTVWKNNWIKDTCMHGLRFSDFEIPFSHKTDAGGYRPDFENIIVPTSRGKKFDEFTYNFYSYERKYSSLCYFSNIASKVLKKEGLIDIRDIELNKLAEISEKRFPNLYIFNSNFSLNSMVEPMKYIHTEFNFTDVDILPDTENIIFQVLIFDDLYYSGTKPKIQDFTTNIPPLCLSCKKWNTGLITLYDSATPPTSCTTWKNSAAIYFKNRMRPHLSAHDARFIALEQFIRQYKLYNKYKKMMFAEPDTYVLKEGGLAEVEKICPPTQDLYLTTFDGQCSLLEKSLEKGLREKIRKCYGIEMLKQMEKDKMKSFYFPFASNSHHFLFLLWKLNLERIYLRDFIFKHDSAFYHCDEATLNVAIWKLKEENKVCGEGLKFADHNSVFSRSNHFSGATIDVLPQIDAIMEDKKLPKLTNTQKIEKTSLIDSCSDINRIKQRNKLEEENESKRNSVRIGHTVRITHKRTGLRLYSSEDKFSTGSKNQALYTFYVHELLQEYGFTIKNEKGEHENGPILRDGMAITIRHGYTGQFLHVYPNYSSPITNQQEVSCRWTDDIYKDPPQKWILRIKGGGELKYYKEFMLENENLGCYLHSHYEGYRGGNEVTCYTYDNDDVNNNWIFIQGYKSKDYY